jgi:hypothetical protein
MQRPQRSFLNPSRVGSKALISQRCANKFGRYVAVVEYGGGGWRSSWRYWKVEVVGDGPDSFLSY